MKTFRVGVIGLGKRGFSLTRDILCEMEGVTVTAVCDLYEDRVENAAKLIEEKCGNVPKKTLDHREVIADADVDVVCIFSAWETHFPFATEAMKAGKPVACEVGGAYTLDECYTLVDTFEKTGTPLYFLENCCYDKKEMIVMNMVKDGLLGELVYCSGAYGHELCGEIATGTEKRHYRERNYLERNCENYPTHELGPIAKMLNINHGNRMVKLTSVATKSVGLKSYIAAGGEHDECVEGKEWAQGDIIITLITCEDGSVIQLKLDTTLPRSYNREITAAGTKGRYTELYDELFLEGDDDAKKSASLFDEKFKKYVPECWSAENEELIKDKGHGGMDWLNFEAFFTALRDGREMPIDAYDMASWGAVTALSEMSIRDGKSYDFPDFTKGKYKTR